MKKRGEREMGRTARKYSISGYMHVIERGIGKQLIFEDEQDYRYYLLLLRKYSKEAAVSVCAYCLMDNHVHLLMCDKNRQLSIMMKKIGVCYTHYFNTKYERTGHLFQDRFLSEPIDSLGYLLTAYRYILNNPVKAKICRVSEYPWSSYGEFYNANSFVDTSWLKETLGEQYPYEKFMELSDYDNCLEFEKDKSDQFARQIIKRFLHIDSGTRLQAYSKPKRDEALRMLKAKGLSIRQIARLTGIGRGIVQRA